MNKKASFLHAYINTKNVIGLMLGSLLSSSLIAAPDTTELQNYLIVATGTGEAFDSNNGELGADQEVLSSGNFDTSKNQDKPVDEQQLHFTYFDNGGTPVYDANGDNSFFSGGPSLKGVFGSDEVGTAEENETRWTIADDKHVEENGGVGTNDFLPGARPLTEVVDYSGNVAITDENGYFVTENTEYFASTGIQCAALDGCMQGDSNNDAWQAGEADDFVIMSEGNGVSEFDPQALLDELDDWSTFINSLDAEYTITSDFVNQNSVDGTGPAVTDLDAIDNNGVGINDGFAVIDIDVSGDFDINNTDWILNTLVDTVAIFRVLNSSNTIITNSSIMMGPGCLSANLTECSTDPITELGAIFYTDSAAGNQVFNMSQSVLGGVAFWDLDDDNDTIITLNNVQGCTQLISSVVELSSTNRLNRCSLSIDGPPPPPTDVPAPNTIVVFLTGCLILLRKRKLK